MGYHRKVTYRQDANGNLVPGRSMLDNGVTCEHPYFNTGRGVQVENLYDTIQDIEVKRENLEKMAKEHAENSANQALLERATELAASELRKDVSRIFQVLL